MKESFTNEILNIEKNIDSETMDKLYRYFVMLKEKNSVMNLTAIRDDEGIIEKHFIDSILMQKYIKNSDKKLIDIGTGAGFPGMVLAIINKDKQFTLLDSVVKKINFLKEVKESLNLENVELISERAEEYIVKRREYYDVGLCRGVSELRVILEYVIPFLKKDGTFLPQKMSYIEEIENAKNALNLLNSKILNIHEFKLPKSKDDRVVIEIIKTGITDKKYPRKVGISKKKPL
ncbi:MAG: 16S rRNA (guanine(527)-N(7))-methyltransferase RsmG [Fusobacteria bacterium]|nr:16S rRNA (guanine(527)-N(7))-methyltransferase RsmG [Fusobacteriota bacterium]